MLCVLDRPLARELAVKVGLGNMGLGNQIIVARCETRNQPIKTARQTYENTNAVKVGRLHGSSQ